MNLFELAAVIKLDSSQYEQGLKTAEHKGLSFAQKLGGGLKTASVAIGAGLAAASTAVIAFGTDAVKTGANFDKSMAQVAATMGKTVDEIQDLREYAQKMGAETAFSASQAADALNYMALAGYDSKTSMEMLPNVLNLAAAGGIELARASDMVTDAQSALGLTLEETAEMVDQMAVTSSKSNTSVAQLGDAILTIGATARGVKGGTTELSAVLGVLADNGIKGAEGGTKLRNMILSLQNPTKEGAAALETLNVSVYDADGNMRSLIDIIEDMQVGLGDMDQASRNAIVSGLFNKQDVAAVNALLGTTRDRFDELTGYISDADGAAKKMANTQLDNLTGDITLMQSALEGAKITLSNSLTPTLRKFVQFGTAEIGKLDKAFQKGGINGLAKQFGKTLGDATKIILSKIPDIVSAAGKLALSFVDTIGSSITKNASKIIRTGLNVIKNLSSELVKRIPDLLGGIGSIIGDVIANIPNILEIAWNIVKGLGEGIIKSIPRIAEGIWKGIKGLFSGPLSEDAKIAVEKIDEINSKMEEWREQQEELRGEITDVDKEYGVYEHWLEIYERLREKTSLTKDEEILLKKAVEELNKILPETDQIIQNETGNWEGNTRAIQANIEAMKLRAKAEIYFSKMNDTLSEMVDLEIQIADEESKLTSYQNELNKAVEKLGYKNVSNLKHEADLLFNTLASGKKPTKEASQALKNYADSLGYSIEDTAGLSQVILALEGDLGAIDDQLLPLQQNFDKQNQLVQNLKKSWGEMNNTVERYMTEGSRLEATASQWETAAHESVDGYIRGLNDKRAEVAAAARGIAGAALQSMRRTLEIASPSKKIRKQIGQMAGRGLALGLLDEVPDVQRASDVLSDAAVPEEYDKEAHAYRGSAETTERTERPIYLVLDSGELVGKTVKKYDRALGVENAMLLRWEGA